MSHYEHLVIVVTAQTDHEAMVAYRAAERLALRCTPVTPSRANGFASFVVVPSGSSVGRSTDNDHVAQLRNFQSWLRASRSVDWVEVRYGGDYGHARVSDSYCHETPERSAAWVVRERACLHELEITLDQELGQDGLRTKGRAP